MIANQLHGLVWSTATDELYESALSVIENTSTIRHSRSRREVDDENSRGAKLKQLEDAIATLDKMQSKAVIETVDGVQRIRGLAGSGKTIVLALKAAYLHAHHPEWRIAVTFNTRSLKDHFRRLIRIFCLGQMGEEPDWEQLRVVNAWGAPGKPERDGIYYEFCRVNDVEYMDFKAAMSEYGMNDAFAGACRHALAQSVGDSKSVYEVILMDEAQDFSPAFLQLCYRLLGDQKRLIYAYDELQSLTGGSLPAPEEIFGAKSNAPLPSSVPAREQGLLSNDIILEKCYRNSRPVLATAHALGFGIYRKPRGHGDIGLVQMFDHPQLWEEIGYRCTAGELRPGSDVTLARTADTSPKFLEDHSEDDDLIQFVSFDSVAEQAEWLVEAVQVNLRDDELRRDDIMVINPDPVTTRRQVGPIRRRLLNLGIECHIAGVDTDADTFGGDMESVTFTGIHRAKGNEAAMVYIINAQDCHESRFNLAEIRNRLFTAITRSKAWIRVLGVGDSMRALVDEYEELKANSFELKFTYPTQEQREHLGIVHRDMSAQERNQIRTSERELANLISRLDSGTIHVRDLDPDVIATLLKRLSQTS